MIKYFFNSSKIMHAKLWTFPGGEVGVAMQPISVYQKINNVFITASCKNSDEFMQLVMFLDAVKRAAPTAKVSLTLPYLPYARQDRVCNPGESLSIAVIARILNSFNLDELHLFDVHSDVSLALFNNVIHTSQAEIWAGQIANSGADIVIAPDAGAAKKIYELHKRGVTLDVVVANKRRDSNGQIVEFTIDRDLIKGKHAIILDDICDGGATFIEVANACRGKVSRLELYVTHGIFSRGVDAVLPHFDKVCTTDSIHGEKLLEVCPGVSLAGRQFFSSI